MLLWRDYWKLTTYSEIKLCGLWLSDWERLADIRKYQKAHLLMVMEVGILQYFRNFTKTCTPSPPPQPNHLCILWYWQEKSLLLEIVFFEYMFREKCDVFELIKFIFVVCKLRWIQRPCSMCENVYLWIIEICYIADAERAITLETTFQRRKQGTKFLLWINPNWMIVHMHLYLLSLFVLCSSFSDAFACRLLVIRMQNSSTAELCAGIDLVVCASSVVQDLL